MIILRQLPSAWRDREVAGYLSEYCRKFLMRFFKECRVIQGERKKLITKDVAVMALTIMGVTERTLALLVGSRDAEARLCVTKNGIQQCIQESKVTVTVEVRVFIRRVLGGVVDLITQYARVLDKPISKDTITILRHLRRRAIASEEQE